jgi:dTDP-4-amino-4,6-dideoxygalactose transaminase
MAFRIYLSPPDLAGSELELVRDAIESNWIAPLGPHVDAFERELCKRADVPHGLALSSGSAALHLALLVLDVGVGDDVWLSTLTFAATANAVAYVGATPVFVDSDRASWNLDPDLLDEALASTTKKPKALIAVDLYGQIANYERIAAACHRHGVALIEDAAEALGATFDGRPAGGFGALGVFSFNGNKIITTSGGGMLVGHDRRHLDRARYLATQARSNVRHYEHEAVGFNYRMSNLLAAVGRAQLADLARRVDARRATNATYRSVLAPLGWEFMAEAPRCRSTFWLTCALTESSEQRDRVIDHLARHQIEARPVWKPMHAQPIFRNARVIGGSVADDLFARGLCLPSGSRLTPAELGEIAALVREAA